MCTNYIHCPRNAGHFIGRSLSELRDTVGAVLRGTDGCTHLNDAVRALADVLGVLGVLGVLAKLDRRS